MVFHRQEARRIVRRRPAGTGARQSDRRRAFRHAAKSHSRSGRRGAEKCRPRFSRTSACSRSGRSSKAIRRPISSRRPRRLRRALAKPSGIGRHWSNPKNGKDRYVVDAFDAKADALAALSAAGAPMAALQIAPGGPAWFHPGRSGAIQIGPQNVLGYFGELHPRVLAELDAEGPLAAFEIILERLPDPKTKADARQSGAGPLAAPAGRARLRLRRGARGESRRRRARSAIGGSQADRSRYRVRRLRRHAASSRAKSPSPFRSLFSRATRP